MLDELRIRGLGVIDDAVLPLGPGLTVVTGETGAGKTMVVTGLLLLFGGRADAARVRNGWEQASVDGRVLVAPDSDAARRVRAAGGELDGDDSDSDSDSDEATADLAGTNTRAKRGSGAAKMATPPAELVLRRVVNATGRSRAYVGGAAAPVAVLGELAEHLLAVHGQSDQLRLSRPVAQRSALDRYAQVDLADYAAAFERWRSAERHLADRTGRAAELRRETDLLAYGIAEIEAVAPQPGETDDLTRASIRLGSAEALQGAAREAHDALRGGSDDSALDATDVIASLGSASRALSTQAGADPELDALAGRLGELASLAADLGAEFGAYADGLETNPAELEQIETRRAALASLVRKYCDEPEPSLDGVLRWADAARVRLADIDVSDEALDALRAAATAAAEDTALLAADVSGRRRRAAKTLGEAITAELGGLAMPDATLTVEVRTRPLGSGTPELEVNGSPAGATADGVDEVEFVLQPHPGAPALPLSRGASGGELSRVMLAVEVCLVGSDPVPTMVFDEVDAGVGGRAAIEVGRRLARLAEGRQVLVVTHLPQVAAFADRHVVVDKPSGRRSDTAAVTRSDVRLVTDDDRVAELARMLAGSDTVTAREHATELLAAASAPRNGATTKTRTTTASTSTGRKAAPRGGKKSA